MLATFMLRRREGMAASNYREVLGDKLFRSVCILADFLCRQEKQI